ncbi:MAG: hypothetical protein PWP58_794 [Bacillota bacterium]|jgi:SMC interacting uncharacterized protein involved in chromosome segregation|nr:hypothetical protein [Bacillota bacterium]
MNQAGWEELESLKAKINGLEAKIAKLRLGRRVLMNLLELLESRRRAERHELERELARLKEENRKLSQLLREKRRVLTGV